MKRKDCSTTAVILAALTIIACSASSMFRCRQRRHEQKRFTEVAEQTWEDEGGAVRPELDEELA